VFALDFSRLGFWTARTDVHAINWDAARFLPDDAQALADVRTRLAEIGTQIGVGAGLMVGVDAAVVEDEESIAADAPEPRRRVEEGGHPVGPLIVIPR
jgi:hypothetical protein